MKRKLIVGLVIAILAASLSGCAGCEEAEVDKTLPVISGVSVSNITGTSVVISWTTDEPATSQVEYGGFYCYGSVACSSFPDESLVTSHSFSLSELIPNGSYWFRVISKDKAGNERQSQEYTFATHLEIDEVISCDTTWTKEGSPYIITANLLIPNATTLTIEPGVTVKFESGKAMQIDGELVARGTEAEPIVFTSNQPSPAPGDWGNILFTDSSVHATCDEMGNYLSGCIMQYCAVEYGGSYAPLTKYTPAIKLIFSSPLIDHCTIINNAGGGIYMLRGSATIANSVISKNSAFCWGGGICCFYHDGAVNIKGNTISHNSVGFSGGGIYADCYHGTLTISGNEISGNSADIGGGGGVLLNCYGGAVTISSNIITNNSGGGICCSCHSRYGTVTVSGNIISDNSDYNSGGIYCWVEDGTISIDHNEIRGNSENGIYIFRGNPVVNYNNLVGNTSCEVYDNDWTDSPPVDATRNWWGTTDEAEIVEKVCRRSYGAGQRMVNYSSYLTEAVPIEEPALGSNVYVGMLKVVTNCVIPEGCGPKYRLYDLEFKSFIPLRGDLREEDSGLVIFLIGINTTLPPSEYGSVNYRGPYEAIEVTSYSTLSRIPYHDFLVRKAGEYTLQKYPCLAHEMAGRIFTEWNKTFSWEVIENKPVLKVRMTDTSTDSASQPFYELSYDGISGSFIKETVEPSGQVFCSQGGGALSAGAWVGIAFGILLLAVSGYILWRRRKLVGS